jgi:hypothetical protein
MRSADPSYRSVVPCHYNLFLLRCRWSPPPFEPATEIALRKCQFSEFFTRPRFIGGRSGDRATQSTSVHNELAVSAQGETKKEISPVSIEHSKDLIDQRLQVEVVGWRNADTPTGFFDLTGNDRPNGGYFCPEQTLS